MTKQIYEMIESIFSVLQGTEKHAGVDDHLSIDNWEWPTGIALYALYDIANTLNSKPLSDFVIRWYEEKLDSYTPHRNVNTVAPLLTLIHLYEKDPRPQWKNILEDWIDWVLNEMPKTTYGGFQHTTVLNSHYEQLWDDTLFMVVLFLAKAGLVLNRSELVEEAKYQFLLHIKYLQDQITGLWYHGWTFDYRNHFGGVFWARGNSWFTAGSVEILSWLPSDDAVAKLILSSLVDQVKELKKFQRQDGLFPTIVNSEESYPETSATANIAFGVMKGIRLGYLPSEYMDVAQKAIQGVLKNVREDGIVEGVSYGTGMGLNAQFYRDIPLRTTAYGQGLTLLMLSELLKNDDMLEHFLKGDSNIHNMK